MVGNIPYFLNSGHVFLTINFTVIFLSLLFNSMLYSTNFKIVTQLELPVYSVVLSDYENNSMKVHVQCSGFKCTRVS